MEKSCFDFGLCSFVYRWTIGRPYHRPVNPMTVEQFVQKSIGYGIKNVLLCNNCELENFSEERLAGLKKLLEDNEVRVAVGSRGSDLAYFQKMVEVAHYLGAKVLRMSYDIDRTVGKEGIRTQIGTCKACIRKLLPKLHEYGLTLAVENGRNMHLTEIRDLVLAVDDTAVGTCLDTMNSVSDVEKPEAVFDILGPYAKMVHFKDWQIVDNKRGNVLTGRALGDGVVDFEGLRDRLCKLGYTGSIFLELYVDHKDTEEETYEYEDLCVQRSLAYAKELGLIC